MQKTCNDELEWYKSLKDAQDSVTSFEEMNSILKSGTYHVGHKTTTVFTVFKNIHDIVEVKLRNTDKRITKRRYTFEELQELESKLVLITGSKAQNREQVELFLDVRDVDTVYMHGYIAVHPFIHTDVSWNISRC